MSYPNVSFNILATNGTPATDADAVVALVVFSATPIPSVAYGVPTPLYALAQVEARGITQNYDTSSNVPLWRNLAEIYAKAPNAEVWLLVLQPTPSGRMDLFQPATGVPTLNALLVPRNGRIVLTGVLFSEYSAGFTQSELPQLVSAAQSYANFLAASGLWCLLVLEACDVQYGAIPDFRALNAPSVAVVAGADVNMPPGAGNVGAFIANFVSATPIGASPCEASEKNNLTNIGRGWWTDAIVDNATGVSVFTDLPTLTELHTKGIIHPRPFPTRSGFWHQQSTTCAPENNTLSSVERVRVMHKIQRLLASVMQPLLNATFPVTTAGRIERTSAAQVEEQIRNVLGTISTSFSSIAELVVDPAVDEYNTPYPSFLTDKVLRVRLAIVPLGKAETIVVSTSYQI